MMMKKAKRRKVYLKLNQLNKMKKGMQLFMTHNHC